MAHRVFKDRPSPLFEEDVRAHVKRTGRPEDHPDLYHAGIASNEPFLKLCPIDVDAKQRPEGDRVNCPMCTPNRFLSGFLCWFPEKHFCAVIGHCCADSETAAAADAVYRIEREQRYEEDYLMAALPLIAEKQQALATLKPSADEARRLYCKLRRAKAIHRSLREIAREGGRLLLYE